MTNEQITAEAEERYSFDEQLEKVAFFQGAIFAQDNSTKCETVIWNERNNLNLQDFVDRLISEEHGIVCITPLWIRAELVCESLIIYK